MGTSRFIVYLSLAASLLLAACASSPMDEQRRLERAQAVEDILSYRLDPLEYGETRRCLSSAEVDYYRPIDNKHILFKGHRDKLWVSTLRGACPGLDEDSTLIVRKFSHSQVCRLDSFEVVDWFGGPAASTGMRCVLGDFQPVTQAQIDEIEAILDAP